MNAGPRAFYAAGAATITPPACDATRLRGGRDQQHRPTAPETHSACLREQEAVGKQSEERRLYGLFIRLFRRLGGLRATGLYCRRNRVRQFIRVSVCYGFGFGL